MREQMTQYQSKYKLQEIANGTEWRSLTHPLECHHGLALVVMSKAKNGTIERKVFDLRFAIVVRITTASAVYLQTASPHHG